MFLDERNLASELAAEKAAKNAKDVMLTEAAHILSDEVGLLKTDTRMAAAYLDIYRKRLRAAAL